MVRGGGSLVLCLHQVKTSTSTEILQLDEKLNEVRVECNQLKDSKVGVAMVIMFCVAIVLFRMRQKRYCTFTVRTTIMLKNKILSDTRAHTREM